MRTHCTSTVVGAGDSDCSAVCESFDAQEQACRLNRARATEAAPDMCSLADVGGAGCGGDAEDCEDLCTSALTCGAVTRGLVDECIAICEGDDLLAICWAEQRCPRIGECGCSAFDPGTCGVNESCRALGPRGGGVCLPGQQNQGDQCDPNNGCANGFICDRRPCLDTTSCGGFPCNDGVCSVGHCTIPCSLSSEDEDGCLLMEVCDPSNPLTGTAVCAQPDGPLVPVGDPCDEAGVLCADRSVCGTTPLGGNRCQQVCVEDADCAEGTPCTFNVDLGLYLCDL